jgi:peptide-methionine (R)-S-oxide reductase
MSRQIGTKIMNMSRRHLIIGGLSLAALARVDTVLANAKGNFPYKLSEAQWRKRLSPTAFAVLRQEATERPFTSPLNKEKRKGIFTCAGCALPLFSSDTKFESGTGWPSFWQPLPKAVGTSVDNSLFAERVEVHCARCGGHLGHVFDDGPKPTGKRYCMNGAALSFRPVA